VKSHDYDHDPVSSHLLSSHFLDFGSPHTGFLDFGVKLRELPILISSDQEKSL
jgi:hypothetical protein